MIWAKKIADFVKGFIVGEQCAQQRLLDLNIARRCSVMPSQWLSALTCWASVRGHYLIGVEHRGINAVDDVRRVSVIECRWSKVLFILVHGQKCSRI